MINHSSHSIKKLIGLLLAAALITACASDPEKQRPEVTETAYKNLSAGVSNYNKSKYSQAQTQFKSALSLFRSIDHREGAASSCLNIAKTHLETNQLELAKDYIDISESLILTSNIDSLKTHLAITKSTLAIANNNIDAAKNILDPLIKSEQNNAIKLAALQNRIRIAFEEDDIDTAKKLITTFSASLSNHKDSTYQARLNRFQANLSTDKPEATKKFQEALAIYKKHAHKPGIASTLHEWGDRLMDDNDLPGAEDKLLRALFVRQSIQDEAGSIRLLMSLKALYEKRDDIKSANETVRWINKLSATRFNRWERFIKTFNTYPAN